MKSTAGPLILILFGIAWLLHGMGWIIDWRMLAAAALAVAGVLVLVLEGITRSSVVKGPMLVYGGAAWYAYQQRMFEWKLLVPVGLILLGLCLVISRISHLPTRRRSAQERREADVLPPR